MSSVTIDGYVPPKIIGIEERPRPLSTGHCGATECLHISHYSKPKHKRPRKERTNGSSN